ncbi:CocE/NonD family hydrolase [Puia dinghuensis]|uniref:Glutaryl-7-ACA acylase n=1 Tax=Puia dinghuensis TaxID=1792502 RepID=A0A8J2U9G6_9BACT|nr:CocE/NonD family hydrolase [Puia dinghuensis]GGA88348.1 glutaryl-7-ACA acylase [Puia dinghuensis]
MLKPILLSLLLLPLLSTCQNNKPTAPDPDYVKHNFDKTEVNIPMRDGRRLFTVIYAPKDHSHPWPFLMERTPYSAGPYGDTIYKRGIGPSGRLMRDGYIFVYQDVRGRYMSEGDFQEMTPAKDHTRNSKATDESTDTWDTVDWLLKHVQNNNGRVGLWGISYPGFYASASLPDAHPAIKAVSPQAPVTDEFIGDDANHNGAFFLLDNFDFDNFFDIPRPTPIKDYGRTLFRADIRDAYQFFLDLGPLKNSNNAEYFNNQGKIWNEYLGNSTYDDYWQARNIRTHLKNIRPAVLVVGGWFDAEDMFGALRTYEAIEKQSTPNDNHLIMGPWTHGAWAGGNWTRFGPLDFKQNVNEYYHELETQFFNHYLKDSAAQPLAEATVFETGSNQWKQYATWPPKEATPVKFFLQDKGGLSREAPTPGSFDEYTSDPAHPVPYIDGIHGGRDNQYIVTDQRFAAQRSDVLVYQTDPLTDSLTVTGRLKADIFLSSTGTDADLIVKLIDVLPAREDGIITTTEPTGYQRLVRAEVFRCKFRNSFEKPEPLVPGQPTEVAFDINEIAHTFKKGHRIMVQVQSSWFPLVDRNPQTFVNIPTATQNDFQKATIRIYHDASHPSGIILPVLR